MVNFKSFGLAANLIENLARLSITVPTPIQEQAIPAALKGKDLLATAQTGTGKTLAYLLPIISKTQDVSRQHALILAPTRELAEQIKNALVSLLGRRSQNDVALLIGGASIFKQFIALKRQPRFIIGTPGRIIDHLERGKLSLDDVKFLVLDEVDRMLDMGFSEALETIIKQIPSERQTLMFSATLPGNIVKISRKYLKDPAHITIGSTTKAAVEIKQEMVKISASERFTHLIKELDTREGSVIIFVKTKVGADVLAEKLQKKEYAAEAIHGDLRQRRREAVIRAFRKGVSRILVATDVAARGLDIPHIKHVINFDLPQCPEDYIHRIGRTGRAGMEGFALSYVLPNEGGKWKAIHRLLNLDPSKGHPDQVDRSDRRSEKSRSKPRRHQKNKMGHPKKEMGYSNQSRKPKRAAPKVNRDKAKRKDRAIS